jgi:peptidoglycan/LPS O-acetylase OafA/YrhL
MSSLERQGASGSPVMRQFSVFMLRRCFRILPLSMLVVTVVQVLSLPVGHLRDGHFEVVRTNGFGFLSNLFLTQKITGHDSIVAPLWSLSFEMQMYVVLPALFLIAVRPYALRLLAPLWIASVLIALSPMRAYWEMLLFVPTFLGGVIAYGVSRALPQRFPAAAFPVLLAALVYIFLKRPTDKVGWTCALLLGLLTPQFCELRAPWSSERARSLHATRTGSISHTSSSFGSPSIVLAACHSRCAGVFFWERAPWCRWPSIIWSKSL